MSNATIVYILWFFFGWAGLHHLYLGRPYQAIVWCVTLGGGCGIGWIRDFWKIPDYLSWSNGEEKRARCSWFRFVGMFVMGFLASSLLATLVPDFATISSDSPEYFTLKYILLFLLIAGNTLGVYLVANIGDLRCNLYYPFASSLGTTPFLMGRSVNMALPCFLTVFITWYKGLRGRDAAKEALKRKGWIETLSNVTIYILACTAWFTVLGCGIYFNSFVTTESGERIPVRVALNNFFKSEAWKKAKDSFVHLLRVLWHKGPTQTFKDAYRLFDFSGETNAYKVLNLQKGVSQEEVTRHCRKLSAQNHPDRFKTEAEKQTAQEKFIEIQDACKIVLASTSVSRNTKDHK